MSNETTHRRRIYVTDELLDVFRDWRKYAIFWAYSDISQQQNTYPHDLEHSMSHVRLEIDGEEYWIRPEIMMIVPSYEFKGGKPKFRIKLRNTDNGADDVILLDDYHMDELSWGDKLVAEYKGHEFVFLIDMSDHDDYQYEWWLDDIPELVEKET